MISQQTESTLDNIIIYSFGYLGGLFIWDSVIVDKHINRINVTKSTFNAVRFP